SQRRSGSAGCIGPRSERQCRANERSVLESRGSRVGTTRYGPVRSVVHLAERLRRKRAAAVQLGGVGAQLGGVAAQLGGVAAQLGGDAGLRNSHVDSVIPRSTLRRRPSKPSNEQESPMPSRSLAIAGITAAAALVTAPLSAQQKVDLSP